MLEDAFKKLGKTGKVELSDVKKYLEDGDFNHDGKL